MGMSSIRCLCVCVCICVCLPSIVCVSSIRCLVRMKRKYVCVYVCVRESAELDGKFVKTAASNCCWGTMLVRDSRCGPRERTLDAGSREVRRQAVAEVDRSSTQFSSQA